MIFIYTYLTPYNFFFFLSFPLSLSTFNTSSSQTSMSVFLNWCTSHLPFHQCLPTNVSSHKPRNFSTFLGGRLLQQFSLMLPLQLFTDRLMLNNINWKRTGDLLWLPLFTLPNWYVKILLKGQFRGLTENNVFFCKKYQ